MKMLLFSLLPSSSGVGQAFCHIKKGVVLYTCLICCMASCAHYPVNAPLTEFNPHSGYRFGTLPPDSRSEELFVILAFSGGGTRAASLSYGVLEELARTEIEINGTKRRLLDEIDIISSVSGGSFTSAYYALFGDRIFEDFEERFLNRNIQGSLIVRLINPWYWPRFWSPGYNRDDMAVELYDKYLFEGKTFGDLLQRPEAPYLIINATDVSSGYRFEFTQNQFDLFYSDLSSFPVSRAVTASSAVPGLFGTIRLNNQSEETESLHLKWVEEVLDDVESPLRLIREAEEADAYQNRNKRKYIHLVDGGVADNLGLRGIMDMIIKQKIAPNRAQTHLSKSLQKVLIIVVDSHVETERGFSHKESLGFFSLIGASVGIPIDRFSFETIELCERVLEERVAEIRKDRAKDIKIEPGSKTGMAVPGPHLYTVVLQFNNLPNKEDSEFFRSMPTSFKLKGTDVDRLRRIAAQQLRNASTFQNLLRDLNTERLPENGQ
jgi:NTE family protein